MESTLYDEKIMLAVFKAFLENPKMIDTVPVKTSDGGIRDKETWKIANEYVPLPNSAAHRSFSERVHCRSEHAFNNSPAE